MSCTHRAGCARQPSKCFCKAVEWLMLERVGRLPSDPALTGKWMLFVPSHSVDAVWAEVCRLLRAGSLGDTAKVSPAGEPLHLICVYLNDCNDEQLVLRALLVLRDAPALGAATGGLNFKTDKATREGKYAANGDKGVSKYSSPARSRGGPIELVHNHEGASCKERVLVARAPAAVLASEAPPAAQALSATGAAALAAFMLPLRPRYLTPSQAVTAARKPAGQKRMRSER